MNRTRPTVADLRAGKGIAQRTMVYVTTTDEAAACAEAGIDILSIEQAVWNVAMREAAADCFVQVGLPYGVLATTDDHLRAAHDAILAGADAVYCAASLQVIERLAAEGIPVVGHVGLIPSRRTWTGGFRAVGKSLESALSIQHQVEALERAGAFAAEIEVVPFEIAAEISRRTSLLMFSMGAGAGCDAMYLFAEDILGETRGHRPRHAKAYRDFSAEYERLQRERVGAFREFRADVASGGYPQGAHDVPVDAEVLGAFVAHLDREPSGEQHLDSNHSIAPERSRSS
ncbi:MAG: 3-methyl-2-oxobutanoate hydroxymethyltransferase [Ilumatobacteraceae bacterium]